MPSARFRFRSMSAQVLMGIVPVAVYALLMLWLDLAVSTRYPFFMFFPAVLFAARYGGMLAGSITSVLAAVVLSARWLLPELQRQTGETVAALSIFTLMGLAISMVHARLYTREEELHALAEQSAQRANELEATMNALRASERAKDDFLATLSHELRTPLNVILGYARMLSSKATDDCQRYAAIVERNAVAQLRLVEDLLDMQRIVNGRFTIEQTQFDLSSLSRAVIDSLRPQAEAKGLHLVCRIPPIVMPGDPARIQQVIWNLLSNAIKFTPTDGCVGMHATRRGGSVIIHVEDSGQGIPPDFLPHVFERFRQLESGRTRRHFGMGLGLAIVKEIVQAHGGTVAAHSAGEGKGATFVVSLPAGT